MTALTAPEIVQRRFRQSIETPTAFFEAHADAISRACLSMARRFHRGGRLLVFGSGGCATDAQHVAVEFVHPVIVGKRALPAIALSNDAASLTGIVQTRGRDQMFARQIDILAQQQDIVLGITVDQHDPAVLSGLRRAAERRLLTLGLFGAQAPEGLALDFYFSVPASDPLVVQETHETLYHILWELVHVFFEHQGLLA